MENTDVLIALAQIAIAFAGFASIVLALGYERGEGWSEVDRYRVRSLLLWSLTVTFCALLPIAVFHLGVDLVLTWRLSSILVATVTLWSALDSYRQSQPLKTELAAQPGFHGISLLNGTVGTVVILLPLANSFASTPNFGLYFVTLLGLLFMAAGQFVRAILVRTR